MIRLSIILPVYNVEKYIAECLESVYNQDISESEYEVICVNDRSPDRSRDVILDFKKKHKNLILIEHETNKRQGAARNTGLRAARGKYLWFIDPDDFIAENCFAELLENAESSDLDILFFDYSEVDETGKFIKNCEFNFHNKICEGKDVLKDKKNCWKIAGGYPFRRLIKKNLILQNNIFFSEGKVFMEDVGFSIHCFILAKKIKYLPKIFYFYRQHSTSAIHALNPYQKAPKVISMCVDLAKMIKLSENQDIIEFLTGHINYFANNEFKTMLFLSPAKRKIMFKELSQIKEMLIIFPYIDKKTKIALTHKNLMNLWAIIALVLKKLKLI